MATSKRDTLIVGLRNAYGLEGQALSTMENVHSRLEHYPELKAAVGQHIEETRRQQQMVEQCLSRFGESPSGLKEAAMKLMGNLQAMVHATTSDEVLKNLFGLYAFEHFEIASYKSLLALADPAGATSAKPALETSLREEEQMASWIDANVQKVTLEYLAREQRAGT